MLTSKPCTGCGKEKPFSAYGPKRRGRFGLEAKCKECRGADLAAWREANRAACLEYDTGRYRANRAANLERQTKRYALVRDAARVVMGGRCVECSATDGLEFDHIEGGGAAHRGGSGNRNYITRIARTGVPDARLQLLCERCHKAKTASENRERAMAR